MTDATWDLCIGTIKRSWKLKAREALFYVRTTDLQPLRDRLIDAGYSVHVISIATDTGATKIAIRW